MQKFFRIHFVCGWVIYTCPQHNTDLVFAARKGSPFWSAACSCQKNCTECLSFFSSSTSHSNLWTDLAIVTSLPCLYWRGNIFSSSHFFSIYLAPHDNVLQVCVDWFVRTGVRVHENVHMLPWNSGSAPRRWPGSLDRLWVLCLKWNCKQRMEKVCL